MNIIATARRAKNLTQVELAERVGTVAQYISQIERDIRQPGMNLARKLAKALNLGLYDIRPDWAE